MRYAKFDITGSNAYHEINNFILSKYPNVYTRTRDNLTILILEDFNYWNFSSYTLTIILDRINSSDNDRIHIEIIGSGSGEGFFNFDWWKTKRIIKDVYKSLASYSYKKGFTTGELDIVLDEYC
jgi:hypothetical protein